MFSLLASFDKALQVKPDYADAYYNKAVCHVLQGQDDLALDALQLAIEINPRYKQEAKTDTNFEVIREDGWFRQLVNR
ncbi:MAG: tetratricopeptide repeat protein [Merismopedia sp. SIO2A8]|nr:tetratricopeptide repeat protein [Merismopedia sp. SIO2A8]